MVNKTALLFGLFLIVAKLNIHASDYWQQEVNYDIEVKLNDVDHEVEGYIEIDYQNNSPDTLTYIFFHLWPNAYRDNTTELAKQLLKKHELDFYYSKKEDRGYISKIDFKVNNSTVQWTEHNNLNDVVKLELNEPLLPNGSVTISTPFLTKIPLGIYSRLGQINQTYQLTQWYPKPAVYDKNGWHPMPYLTQGEFYSEFGSYNVKITLPSNYVVGSTGDLQGKSAITETKWLNELNKETLKKIRRAKDDGWKNVFSRTNDVTETVSSNKTKTLHYFQKNVHDFAWFANKEWNVLKGNVLMPKTQRSVTTWAMFTDEEARKWENAPEYLHDAVYYYSLWNGEYPYNQVTAVDGALSAGGGMEYPNVTIIGKTSSKILLEEVIMHEVGHNWFYGILGSNERDHPWMDEGINSANESRYLETKYSNALLSKMFSELAHKALGESDPSINQMHYLLFMHALSRGLDQAANLKATDYTDINYGEIVYAKPSICFNYLRNYLGDELFDKMMQQYFETWKFKHPQPEDLSAIFAANVQENLDWFFTDLLTTEKTIDYSISNVKASNDSLLITITNHGDIASPFHLTVFNKDRTVHNGWYKGTSDKVNVKVAAKNFTMIEIDHDRVIPEDNRNNNRYHNLLIFPTFDPVTVKKISNLDNPTKNELYILPAVGYNLHDKFMLGLVFHNFNFPFKKMNFWVNPLYSFKSKSLSGNFKLNYFLKKPLSFIQTAEIGVKGQQFGTRLSGEDATKHQKLDPYINIVFKKRNFTSDYTNSVRFRTPMINNKYFESDENTRKTNNSVKNYVDLTYTLSRNHALAPFEFNGNWQSGPDYSKVSATFNYTRRLNEKGAKFKARLFFGKFLNKTELINHAFTLGATRATNNNKFFEGNRPELYEIRNTDYLYDEIFLGRSGPMFGMLSQQIGDGNGGFKTSVAYGRASDWMLTGNFSVNLPLKFISIFGDIGTSNSIFNSTISENKFVYDAGVQLTVIEDVFDIYFPLIISDEINGEHETIGLNFWQEIRFKINFNRLKITDVIRNY